MLRRHAGVAQVEARDPGEVAAALAELADPPPDVLVVNGGDGTVQAVLTTLLLDRPMAQAFRERGAVRVSTGGWPSFLQI